MLAAKRSKMPQPRISQIGFTLIEVLIAFLILSIGILGIASLLTVSKTSQYEAVQRTRAINLADDMLERIRINPAGLVTYTSGTQPLGAATVTTQPSPDCISAGCTSAQLAAHDLWAWEQILDGESVQVTVGGVSSGVSGLTNPTGCINFIADTGKLRTGQVTVLVQWRGLHNSSDGVAPGGVACGGLGPDLDDFRRQVTATTYVIDEAEI